MTWPAPSNPFGPAAASRVRFPVLGSGLVRNALQSLPAQARREIAPDTTSALQWAKDHPIVTGLLGVIAWKVPILALGLGAATWVVDRLCRGNREVGPLQAPGWASAAVHALNRNSGIVASSIALTALVCPWISACGLTALAAVHRLAAHLPNPRFGQ